MIKFVIGNICESHVDAIVNPTDTFLSGSGGVDWHIHKLAGKTMSDECKKAGSCPIGNTVLTSGGNLFTKYVIHTAVPKWESNSQNAEYLLAACYVNSLNTAKENNINSIAFSAIGTGTNSFPVERAAEISMAVIWEWYIAHRECPQITIVLTSESKMKIYKKAFLLNVLKTFHTTFSPEHLAFLTAHTLPYYFEQHGGFSKLSDKKEEQVNIYRDKINNLHHLYSDYMDILYDIIGKPDYFSFVERGLNRINNDVEKDEVKKFLSHLNLMQFDECVCFIVFLKRMDYASGGVDSTHLKNCVNGNIRKILNYMERLLIEE